MIFISSDEGLADDKKVMRHVHAFLGSGWIFDKDAPDTLIVVELHVPRKTMIDGEFFTLIGYLEEDDHHWNLHYSQKGGITAMAGGERPWSGPYHDHLVSALSGEAKKWDHEWIPFMKRKRWL